MFSIFYDGRAPEYTIKFTIGLSSAAIPFHIFSNSFFG